MGFANETEKLISTFTPKQKTIYQLVQYLAGLENKMETKVEVSWEYGLSAGDILNRVAQWGVAGLQMPQPGNYASFSWFFHQDSKSFGCGDIRIIDHSEGAYHVRANIGSLKDLMPYFDEAFKDSAYPVKIIV